MARPQSTSEEAERVKSLWALLATTGDFEVRNEIIEHYLPWCRDVARAMYQRRGGLPSEFGDYLQMTTLAMIECVPLFDPAQGVPFEAFALPRVRGKVFNELHALSERHEQVFLQTRLRAQRAESLRDGPGNTGAPGSRDAFEHLVQLTVGLAVGYMLEGTQLFKDESAPPMAPSAYDNVEMARQCEWMQRLVLTLPDQERRVMRYHYFHGLPLSDAANLLGLTRGRVSQIHRQALDHLRELSSRRRLNVKF